MYSDNIIEGSMTLVILKQGDLDDKANKEPL